MHDDLRGRVRAAAGRKTAPTAAIVDSQSVKGSEMVARTGRGYDAGKKINGRKRHIAVDTGGLLLTVLVTWAKAAINLTLEIVKQPDDLHAFTVLPRRWVVERTLSWNTRHRRTVRDYERLPVRHETYVYWSMIIVMTRRLAR
jgi:Transposase DDE domain